jgi:ADP-ribose pyrophosphatase
MDDERVEILERRTAHQGFFRVDRYRLRHRLHDGGWGPIIEREVIERRPAAGVLLYDPDRDAVVLVEQFRLPAHLAGFAAWQVEIVAGLLDPGETAAEVARRETREETGLDPIGELVPMHRYLTSPGGTTETVSLFCARVESAGAGGVHGLAEEGEDIRVLVLPYAEAMEMIREDRIANGLAIIALYWLAAHRDELRRLWLGSRSER